MTNIIEHGPVATKLRLPYYHPSQHPPEFPFAKIILTIADALTALFFLSIAAATCTAMLITPDAGYILAFLVALYLVVRFSHFAWQAAKESVRAIRELAQWISDCEMEPLVNMRRQSRFYGNEAWYCPSCDGVFLCGRHEVLPANRLAELLDRP